MEADHSRRPLYHYSFTLAGWRILSLNSEDSVEPGSAQLSWLEDELSGPGNCRLAFWHAPRYSAGTGTATAPTSLRSGTRSRAAPRWS